VFKNSRDLALRIDLDDLDVMEDSVLVLQGIGLVGNPGMPEAGLIPIPWKLAKKGVTDMLRISDGMMSGIAGGIIVLYISPELVDPDSVFGIVQDGDFISCNVAERLLQLEVEESKVKKRIENRKKNLAGGKGRDSWQARKTQRGYLGLYERNVNQAEKGCDFDFLTAYPEASVDTI